MAADLEYELRVAFLEFLYIFGCFLKCCEPFSRDVVFVDAEIDYQDIQGLNKVFG